MKIEFKEQCLSLANSTKNHSHRSYQDTVITTLRDS